MSVLTKPFIFLHSLLLKPARSPIGGLTTKRNSSVWRDLFSSLLIVGVSIGVLILIRILLNFTSWHQRWLLQTGQGQGTWWSLVVILVWVTIGKLRARTRENGRFRVTFPFLGIGDWDGNIRLLMGYTFLRYVALLGRSFNP